MALPLQVPDDDVSIYSLVSCSAVLMAVGFFSLIHRSLRDVGFQKG